MTRRVVEALVALPVGVIIARVAVLVAEATGPWWLWMAVAGGGCLVITWGLVELGERWLSKRLARRAARSANRETVERLRVENDALRAENAVLADEVQSLDSDLMAAREGRIGGVA